MYLKFDHSTLEIHWYPRIIFDETIAIEDDVIKAYPISVSAISETQSNGTYKYTIPVQNSTRYITDGKQFYEGNSFCVTKPTSYLPFELGLL